VSAREERREPNLHDDSRDRTAVSVQVLHQLRNELAEALSDLILVRDVLLIRPLVAVAARHVGLVRDVAR
jgi:hypothetical protein